MTDRPQEGVTAEGVHRSAEAELLYDLIHTRRSIRRFRPESVPEAVIERILGAASRAPSAHNRQPWRFVVLRSKSSRFEISRAMGVEFARALKKEGKTEEQIQAALERSRRRITGAPLAILLCLDPEELDHYVDENRDRGEELIAVQSVAIAGGYLLLAAHAEGLGGVWVCAPLFAPGAVQEALRLPAGWMPQAVLLLGYPASLPADRGRRPLREVRLDL